MPPETLPHVAVVAKTNSIADPTHCDIMIFVHEHDARAAVRCIGGEESINMPEPLRRLVDVRVEDAAALTTKWDPPPWEPPSFRDLKFGRADGLNHPLKGSSYILPPIGELSIEWSGLAADSHGRRRAGDQRCQLSDGHPSGAHSARVVSTSRQTREPFPSPADTNRGNESARI